MLRVLVVDSQKKPLMPCFPARARELLRKGKAAVYRRYPFTIILKNRKEGNTQQLELKIDPGNGKKTGKYQGRVAVRSSGNFNIKTVTEIVQGIHYKYCKPLHRSDGYNYYIGGGVSSFC